MPKPQNRAKTGGRTAKGRFPKGTSGNPGGRPKGFGEAVRELTRDGMEMVQVALRVMRGELTVLAHAEDGSAYDVEPSVKERMDAAKFLTERAFGKPHQSVELTAEIEAAVSNPLEGLTREELLALARAGLSPAAATQD